MRKDSKFKKIEAEKCWICQTKPATTSEHRIKQKLLNDIAKDGRMLHFWDEYSLEKNAKNKSFKFKKMLCVDCNANVTFEGDAIFDRMIEFMSIAKREIGTSSIKMFLSDNIDCSGLQQYYAKLTGCYLLQFRASFDEGHIETLLVELRKVIYKKETNVFSIIFSPLPNDDTIYQLVKDDNTEILLGSYFRNKTIRTKRGFVFSDSLLPFRITIVTNHQWSIDSTEQIYDSRIFYYDKNDIEEILELIIPKIPQ